MNHREHKYTFYLFILKPYWIIPLFDEVRDIIYEVRLGYVKLPWCKTIRAQNIKIFVFNSAICTYALEWNKRDPETILEFAIGLIDFEL